jgi:hypothetical protein
MKRYAIHNAYTFLNSKQAKEENKNAVLLLRKKFKPIVRKLSKHEQKKLKFNAKISKGLYASNYSPAQVDSILGNDYYNKKRWKENLATPLGGILNNMIIMQA